MTAVKAAEVDRAVAQRSPSVRCLLFYGPDVGRVAERSRAAAHSAVEQPDDPFQLVRLDGEVVADDPGRLADEMSTYGMFGGGRAIWVRQTARNIAPAVAACLGAPAGPTLLVVEGGDLARTSPLRTLCETSPLALALPCYGDEARDLGSLVDGTLREAGLRLDPDARALLLETLGGDRLATRGELSKLVLYGLGRPAITVEDVEAVVSDVSGSSLDAVIDAAFAGDMAELEPALVQLWHHGTSPAALLALALRHGLALADRFKQRDEGADVEQLMRAWRGLHFRRQAVVRRQLGRGSTRTAMQAVRCLQEATLTARKSAGLAEAVTGHALIRIARLPRASSSPSP